MTPKNVGKHAVEGLNQGDFDPVCNWEIRYVLVCGPNGTNPIPASIGQIDCEPTAGLKSYYNPTTVLQPLEQFALYKLDWFGTLCRQFDCIGLLRKV
jgi:hypothetical protein